MRNRKFKLAKGVYLYVTKHGYLTYDYKVDVDSVNNQMGFNFTLLSEVGHCIKHIYQTYFENNGYEIETVELDKKPWMQDRIVNWSK